MLQVLGRGVRLALLFVLLALCGCGGGGGNVNLGGGGGMGNGTAAWAGFARDVQHSALSPIGASVLTRIHWQTPVDLMPQFSGNDLLIHYGSPLVSHSNTVIVPVKTGATEGFRVEAHAAGNGALVWEQSTDYVLPPHDWTPSYQPTLAPGGRLLFAGAGGTVLFRTGVDSANSAGQGRLAFFGPANYAARPAAYAGVFINTPLTSDAQGTVYFGFQVTVATAQTTDTHDVVLQSGLARIDVSGVGTWVAASAAAQDGGIRKVAHNCAPALSPDGRTVYVAVNSGTGTSDKGVYGYVVALNSQTLAVTGRVRLKDVKNPALDASVPDDGTASPTIGPDGDVYFGVLENPFASSRGWLLHFDAGLSAKTPGAFGWDDTASLVPASLVPSYRGASSYLLMTKYNNYAELGGDGVNKLALLDPNATQIDARTGATVMREVETVAGVTPDPAQRDAQHPNAVREWCINSAAIDPAGKSVLAGSEDGVLYRWDLAANSFTQRVTLTPGVGEAYTPTVIGPDGTVYAINDATLFAVGP